MGLPTLLNRLGRSCGSQARLQLPRALSTLVQPSATKSTVETATHVGSSPPHHAAPSWYHIRQEERLSPPAEGDLEEGAVFESRHPSQKFANTLSMLRSHYPEHVWHTMSELYPRVREERPLCVDIAVGAEGRGGVELARRGFRVIGVEADAQLLARTFQFAQANNAHIELMTAKVEQSLLADGSADIVTFFHGLHLIDTPAALREAWRLLRPQGTLIAAWNDRNLSSPFIQELEDVMEHHVTSYNRYQKQRGIEEWGERLQEGGLFRLRQFAVHPNPIPIPSASSLLDVLDCMSFIRGTLRGEARKRFNNDVRGLLERRFSRRGFVLPLETKMYVLEKIHADREERDDAVGKDHAAGNQPHRTIFS